MVAVAGRLLRLLQVYEYSPPAGVGWESALDEAHQVFAPEKAAQVSAVDRIAVGEVLGWTGDARFEHGAPEMLPLRSEPDVLLGKYAVTVVEYARFVENNGYGTDRYWGEWWEAKQWETPADWDEQLEHLNRPVVGVSWYEAMAYCSWLAEHTKPPASSAARCTRRRDDGGES